MHKPKLPANPLIDGRLHRDTLTRIMGVLDLLATLDSEALMNGHADYGFYQINRTMNDAVQFVTDDLQDRSAKKHQRKQEKRDRAEAGM